MARRTKVTIEGLDELKAKFKQLQHATQGQILENAVLAGCLPIMNAAIERVPIKSGNLKRSIHIGGHSNLSDTTGTDVGIGVKKPTQVNLRVGTNVEYAPYVEFGTNKQTAKPYLRPAYDENKELAIEEIKQTLRQQIENVS